MKIPAAFTFAVSSVLLALVLGGCVNLDPVRDPTRFYILEPTRVSLSGEMPDGFSLFVERVEIPVYLDDRRIVRRRSRTEVAYSDYHRWGEPLNDGIARVVAANLGRMPGIQRVSHTPWAGPDRDAFRLRLRFLRLDLEPDGGANLEVRAELFSPTAQAKLLFGETWQLSASSQGEDYDAIVRTLSQALAYLSEGLAEKLSQTVR